jgi:hypothetical protein
MSDTPTPETDKVAWTPVLGQQYCLPAVALVNADHARRLERDLIAARLSLKIAMEAECLDCANFKDERDEAQRQLEVVEARAGVDERRHESELRKARAESAKYKAWNDESKANAHRALTRADRELEEARAEASRLMEIATSLRDCLPEFGVSPVERKAIAAFEKMKEQAK